MGTVTKTFTLDEALTALGQNNIPFMTGGLTSPANKVIAGVTVIGQACALGQCGLNLGVPPTSLQDAFSKIKLTDGQQLSSVIISYNDSYKYDPSKVEQLVRARLKPEQLQQTFELPTRFTVVVLKAS